MSFFRKKKDEQAAAAAGPNGAPAPAAQPSYGYPGAIAQQQYGAPTPSPYPYGQYPAAVAGYQPPAFHSSGAPQQAGAAAAPVAYQPSAMQAYGSPSPQPQPQQAAYGGAGQAPQMQPQYGGAAPVAGGYPGAQALSQPSYLSHATAHSQPQPQPQAHSYAYNGYPSANSNAAHPAPQPQLGQQPQQYYSNGYPGAQQQPPYAAYNTGRSQTGGAGVAGYGSAASAQPAVTAADMKPWENTQQASARLARAEASESRVAGTVATAHSAKHKTWAQYQEIEREEREKQQRIQMRQQQQQQQQPVTPTAGVSPHHQQLSPDLLSSEAPYHSYAHQAAAAAQQSQDIPDLLSWNEQIKNQPPTPRAADVAAADAQSHADDAAGDRKEVNGYILRPENEEEEEDEDDEEEVEEEEEDDEDEDEVNADEDRKKAEQQQQHDVHQEGAEGQSWQQIGKGRRQPDEFDSDVHGEGQTKEDIVTVTSLIDYAEKQQESLNQPLLASPANAADDMSSFGLVAPAPVSATPIPASFNEFVGEGRQAASSISNGRSYAGSESVVMAAPKRTKKAKKAAASTVAPVTAAMSNVSIVVPQQLVAKPRSPAPPAHQYVEPVNPWLAAPNGMQISPYAQRLYAGFAFQLYTDTSSHDLFLFYEPMDGPRGTLYWCQPGKREKAAQHSMAIHEITHSVLGKHNFPTSNPRAAAAQPIQCFTLYDKTKRLDMCADSGASREEFLKALEELIKDSPAPQALEASRAQPAPAATVAVPVVNASGAAASRSQAVPAQVVQSQPSMQMPPQQQHGGHYLPSPVTVQPSPSSHQASSPWFDGYGRPAAPQPAANLPYSPAHYPQVAPQPQQQYPYAPQYAVPGMNGPVPAAANQPLYGQAGSQPLMQPLLQQQQAPGAMAANGYPAYMMQQQQQQQLQPQMPQSPVVMPPPPQVVQENPDLIKPIHAGVGCDVCKVMPIKDVRYKCTVCFNFDCCEKCERKGKHTKSHPLIKMYSCVRARDVAELFHRAQYKELQQQQLSKRPGVPSHSLLTEDPRFNEYHKDMLGRVMAQAHTLPPATMSHLIELLVQLMTATDDTREQFCHIILRDDKTQRLLLPFPVALDILRLCGFDYVQSKQSGDVMSFQGMEQFDELYFNPRYKLTVVETVVERLLRL